ncbi:hypothetical protein FLAVO9AF_210030 [Flavobacterium sp. 9AF]|uniref:hypothetical protein n=1 Tax=Flavobacterium sp. 9AF TaxID=2653142 RepID=UPI0012F2CFA2|nr:hypothetical protein [Flavobacterium sp. 9AF]VXB58224.1 hypothetical protein FLAVO9AF_210030 [Flavobacterium sp. 9AF]
MRKNHLFPKPLLVTQDEMAMLLRTTRVQWSLYEIGKRDLPLHSKERLQELLSLSIALPVYSKSRRAEEKKQEELHKLDLLDLLKQVQIKSVQTAKKTGKNEKKV